VLFEYLVHVDSALFVFFFCPFILYSIIFYPSIAFYQKALIVGYCIAHVLYCMYCILLKKALLGTNVKLA